MKAPGLENKQGFEILSLKNSGKSLKRFKQNMKWLDLCLNSP